MDQQIINVPVGKLLPSPMNPRKHLGSLVDLIASVKEKGVLEPVMARPIGKTKTFELVFGHRRHAAATAAGVGELVTIVRELDDDEALELMIVENAHREDVHPLDEADGYAELVRRGHDVKYVAEKVGRPVVYIQQRLKLLDLSPACRKAFDGERLTLSLALMIARIPSTKLQDEALVQLQGNDHEGPRSAKTAASVIQARFMLRLADAPFDRSDATLVAGAGACTTCPKRTGNQAELFADVKSPDLCTDPGCHRKKLDAYWKGITTKAKAEGMDVLAEKEAKSLFSSYGSHGMNHSPKFVALSATEYINGNSVKVSSLFPKGEKPAVTLARNPHTGEIVKLVSRSVVTKAANKGKRKAAGATRSSSSSKASAAANKANALKALARKRAGELAMAALVDKVELLEVTAFCSKVVPVLAAALIEICYEVGEKAADRRLEPESKVKKGRPRYRDSTKLLAKNVEKMTPAAQRGLVAELIVSEFVDFEYSGGRGFQLDREKSARELLKSLGVEPKKFEEVALALVRAEQATEEASAPKSKAKSKKPNKAHVADSEFEDPDADEDLDDLEDDGAPAKSPKKKPKAKKKGGRK